MGKYKVVVNLLPPDANPDEVQHVLEQTLGQRETVLFSADDAGALARFGNEASFVRCWDAPRWGDSPTIETWLAENYGVKAQTAVFPDFSEPEGVPAVGFAWNAWPTEFIYRPDGRFGVTQDFGVNPQNYKQFGLPGHEGIDFYAPHGTKIFAIDAGKVTRTGDERGRYIKGKGGHNYGVRVYIDHLDGFQSVYAHLNERLVDVGDEVEAGQLIGYADNTGNSFGDHLHLALKHVDALKQSGTMYQGYPWGIIDPTTYMDDFLKRNRKGGGG